MKDTFHETMTMEQQIIQLVSAENPENMRDLLRLATDRLGLSEKDALAHVMQLIDDGRLELKSTAKLTPKSPKDYIISGRAMWFWITILLATTTVIMVFTVPEDSYPLVYIRYTLGAIFVLVLPGYTLVRVLFPSKVPIKTSSEDLDTIERVVLSFGMSIALVPITGILLNYTPWGIRLTPITLSLLGLTVAFAVVALIRENHARIPSSAKLPSSTPEVPY